MIQVIVENLFLTDEETSGVTLSEKEGERKVQIIVGDFEAQAIALAIEKIQTPRPITHDLIINIIEDSQVQIEKLVIHDIVQNTFLAKLHVLKNGLQCEIDARPSDGIALALRCDAPIFVEEHVFELTKNKQSGLNKTFKPSSPFSEKKESQPSDVSRLEALLKKAVENENYEEAAHVRDELNKIKQQK